MPSSSSSNGFETIRWIRVIAVRQASRNGSLAENFIENAVKQVFKSVVAKEHRNAAAGTLAIDV